MGLFTIEVTSIGEGKWHQIDLHLLVNARHRGYNGTQRGLTRSGTPDCT
jgi:hypothetical protein